MSFLKSFLTGALLIGSLLSCAAEKKSRQASVSSPIPAGTFHLYKSDDHQVIPDCDVHTLLEIVVDTYETKAVLSEAVEGTCMMTIPEDRREYAIYDASVEGTSSGIRLYQDMNMNPTLNSWSLKMLDYRAADRTLHKHAIEVIEKVGPNPQQQLYSNP